MFLPCCYLLLLLGLLLAYLLLVVDISPVLRDVVLQEALRRDGAVPVPEPVPVRGAALSAVKAGVPRRYDC